MRIFLYSFWFWALAIGTVLAQGNSYQFEQVLNGLHEDVGEITTIMQDHRGFLWIGTEDGLRQFDGYRMITYQHDPAKPYSLTNNHILALLEDEDGLIWIGTKDGGLNCLEPETQRIRAYLPQPKDDSSLSHPSVKALAQDETGVIWVGTDGGGLNRLDPATGIFKHYKRKPSNPDSLSHNRINVLLISEPGFIWIGTGGGGLNRLDIKAGTFSHYRHSRMNENSLSSNYINAMVADPDGLIWIGTDRGGLVRFDPRNDLFVKFTHNPKNRYSLSSDNVKAVLKDSLGRLWVGTDQGLNKLDWRSRSFARFRYDRMHPQTISSDSISALFCDRSEILWVGTGNGQLNKLKRKKTPFAHFEKEAKVPHSLGNNNVSSFAEDQDGIIWVGTLGGGLNRFDRVRGEFSQFLRDRNDDQTLSNNRVLALLVDKKEQLWVGTDGGGLNRLEKSSGRFIHYNHEADDPRSLDHDIVWSILEDFLGNIWVGTQSGLNRYNPKTDQFVHVQIREPEGGLSATPSGAVWALYEDHLGMIWIGTEGSGLYQLNPETMKVKHFQYDSTRKDSLSLNVILSICEDMKGHLWIGTWGGGLFRFIREKGTFEALATNEKLPDPVIYGILTDDSGGLWLSTNKGIVWCKPKTEEVRQYNEKDGLINSAFNAGAFFKNRYGEMLFGGTRGFELFRPEEVRVSTTPPPVTVTSMKLFDQVVATDLFGVTSFDFSHNQDFFSFEFSVLDFENPNENQFAIMMEGIDTTWHATDESRQANYKLSPGNYVFRVKGANSRGIWNETGVSIPIRVNPPFWLAWWFIVLESLLAVLVLVAFIFFQRKRYQRQKNKALISMELKRKTEELEAARELQLSLLPKGVPSVPYLDIAVHMKTATEVGGDYYDFYMNDSMMMAVVGDATGHGLQAGTMVAATKALFTSLADHVEPVELLGRASKTLSTMGLPNMYMGMTLARFKGSEVTLTAAAMPYSLLYRAVDDHVEVVELKGLPLGSFQFPYQQKAYILEPGDTLLIASDGFEEMFNSQNQILGYRQVQSLFGQYARKSAQEIIQKLIDFGENWANGHPQEDDMTFLVVKMK